MHPMNCLIELTDVARLSRILYLVGLLLGI
jgi:hypothetical protein